jgi:hypothetical protein
MGHFDVAWLSTLLFLALASFLAWAPIFGLAYSRRNFGGTSQGYIRAWAFTATATTAFFMLGVLWEAPGR